MGKFTMAGVEYLFNPRDILHSEFNMLYTGNGYSQTGLILSIVINGVKHDYISITIKGNYINMFKNKFVINLMLNTHSFEIISLCALVV